MKIYTKTGDKGETSLFGGKRVPKDDLRIEACGAVDELNSVIGIIRSAKVSKSLDTILQRIQKELFILGSDLATPISSSRKSAQVSRITEGHVAAAEAIIDQIQPNLPTLRRFVLPGGSQVSSYLHYARAVCRRVERRVVRLARTENVNPLAISYLNRLSDLLFTLARFANQEAGVREVLWLSPEARGRRRKLRK
jgi:cob(I)alamin adenosyltransferase